MKKNTILRAIFTTTLLFTFVADTSANESQPKSVLRGNYQVIYNKLPESVDNVSEMLKEGLFYGRLRFNSFLYEWEKDNATQDSHKAFGLGGSLIYKSATFENFNFTTGLYYSQGFFDNDKDSVDLLKSAKDLISRYDYTNSGDRSMAVLGQAYINYGGLPKTRISVGRQLVETFYTKSNDTKMIPNTFDGVVLQTKIISDTDIKVAYLAKEKLRDHTTSHSVFMCDNSDMAGHSSWNGNDDSAMHKGLNYINLQTAGVSTDAPLITGDIRNRTFKDTLLSTSFYTVPELLSQAMVEANHKIQFDSFYLSPGVRYIKQFDNGGGEIGGANINGQLAGISGESGGYKDASSLDSQMIAARLVAFYEKYRLNLGYSNVLNEADLVTPWRGFPTVGYTRSMGRYNWMANTKSYRIEFAHGVNNKGIYRDLFMLFSFLHTDADETKGNFDENFYYAGFVQNIPSMIDLQWRLRLGYADTKQNDADNLDARFEINYLF